MPAVRSRGTCVARALPLLLAAMSLLLGACHSSTTLPPGTPVITFGGVNNSADFAAYIVSIDGMTLTSTGGTVVAPLSVAEVIDAQKLSNHMELVEAPAVPSGTYTSATITVDYTSADIWVNVDGTPVLATPLNVDGSLESSQTVTVTFDPDNPLVIPDGSCVRLLIDFDLTASNTETYASTTAATITVQPFVVITPIAVDSTVMRSRGLFVTEQTVASGYIMNARPFYDLVSALGAIIVNTNAQTYFNTNGVTYTGAAGLPPLTQLALDTPLAAYGTLGNMSGITPTFNASAVYAGTSLESPLAEYVNGTVSERIGSTLYVRGATYLTPVGTTTYYEDLPIFIGDGTIVSQDGVAASGLTTSNISVGQLVNLYGQANVNSSTGIPINVDATAGQVRIGSSPLWGTLNSATSNSASLDISTLANFPPAGLNFLGTGSTRADDAVPDDYRVATGSTDLSGVAPGTPLLVNGNPTSFGSAPPDFTASSITTASATMQQLLVEWGTGGGTSPFKSVSDAGLVVNLDNPELSRIHYIRSGPFSQDLMSLPASPLITTVGADTNLVLAVGSAAQLTGTTTTGIEVFNSAARFVNALKFQFSGTNRIYRLVAYGHYDSATNTFVAGRIYVALQESSTT